MDTNISRRKKTVYKIGYSYIRVYRFKHVKKNHYDKVLSVGGTVVPEKQ